MSFLRLFLSVFFVSFCGEKKLDITTDGIIGKDNKEFLNESVYIVEESSDLPDCVAGLEYQLYYIKEDQTFKFCFYDKKSKIFSYEIVDVKGDQGSRGEVGKKGEKGDEGPQGTDGLEGEPGEQGAEGLEGEQGSFEKSINTLPAPTFSRAHSGAWDLVLNIDPYGSSKIFYTTDGSDPNIYSQVYDRSLLLECCTNVTYKAFQTHWLFEDSEIATYNPFLYQYDSTFGEEGSGDGQFESPYGIATDLEGNIYVVDDRREDVQVFDPNGDYVLTIGEPGSGDGEFGDAGSVAVDSLGYVYVGDWDNENIQKFDPNGDWQLTIANGGGINFDNPSGIAIDANDNIYVVDRGTDEVQKFDPNGELLLSFGEEGTGNGQFETPNGIAIDSEGNIYVVDEDRHDVQKFDPNGDWVATFGSNGEGEGEGEGAFSLSGEGDGQFDEPWGIAIDSNNKIYVVDALRRDIQVFDSDGNFFYRFGGEGEEEGMFLDPGWIAIDRDNNIFVLDADRFNVQKIIPINF